MEEMEVQWVIDQDDDQNSVVVMEEVKYNDHFL